MKITDAGEAIETKRRCSPQGLPLLKGFIIKKQTKKTRSTVFARDLFFCPCDSLRRQADCQGRDSATVASRSISESLRTPFRSATTTTTTPPADVTHQRMQFSINGPRSRSLISGFKKNKKIKIRSVGLKCSLSHHRRNEEGPFIFQFIFPILFRAIPPPVDRETNNKNNKKKKKRRGSGSASRNEEETGRESEGHPRERERERERKEDRTGAPKRHAVSFLFSLCAAAVVVVLVLVVLQRTAPAARRHRTRRAGRRSRISPPLFGGLSEPPISDSNGSIGRTSRAPLDAPHTNSRAPAITRRTKVCRSITFFPPYSFVEHETNEPTKKNRRRSSRPPVGSLGVLADVS